jgi:hypothetical protein
VIHPDNLDDLIRLPDLQQYNCGKCTFDHDIGFGSRHNSGHLIAIVRNIEGYGSARRCARVAPTPATTSVATNPSRRQQPAKELGTLTLVHSPAEFTKLVADEAEKWAKVIKFAGIKPE